MTLARSSGLRTRRERSKAQERTLGCILWLLEEGEGAFPVLVVLEAQEAQAVEKAAIQLLV